MMDLQDIRMEIDGEAVELPEGVGLLLRAKPGKPVSILTALLVSMDGPERPVLQSVPCPILLGNDEELTLFHKGLRAFTFVGYRGVAMDPIQREKIDPNFARRRRRR